MSQCVAVCCSVLQCVAAQKGLVPRILRLAKRRCRCEDGALLIAGTALLIATRALFIVW